ANGRRVGQAKQSAVPLVVKETNSEIARAHRIKIQEAVIVIISPCATTISQAANNIGKNSFKGTVAPVMIEEIDRRSGIAYQQIGEAIVVVVTPGDANRQAVISHNWTC